MAITNGYCALDELKSRMGYDTITDYQKDSIYEQNIEAASRWIDRYCHRRFYSDAANSTKYFTSQSINTLYLDEDVVSIGTLATDDGDRTYSYVWAATDYDLMPANGASAGTPYTWIETTPMGNYSFPRMNKGVSIYGKFGLVCPDDVHEACLLLAARFAKRKDAPLGVAGVSELGTIQMIDPIDRDVKTLLQSWRRLS